MWGQKQSNCMGIMMLFLGKERITKGDGVQGLVHRTHGLVKEGVSWTDGIQSVLIALHGASVKKFGIR